VLAALEEGKRSIEKEKDVEGSKREKADDEIERDELVVVDGDVDHRSRLSVIESDADRYSRSDVDVDVGLFPVPPVHLPFAPPPTPMSPSLVSSSTRVSEDHAHEEEEGGGGGVRPRGSSGVGGRRGMTSRWSLASSVEGVDALGVGEGGRRYAKEKEKEKRRSFVAFVAAVAGGGGAPSNAEGVAAGGLEVPTAAASGENSKSETVSSKDPKEKKRGRLASFISRLSYSGGANGLVSPGMFFFSFVFFC